MTQNAPKNVTFDQTWKFLIAYGIPVVRVLWWGIALLASISLIFVRLDSIASDKPTNFDIGLLGITAILILLPFVSEMSVFGFTIKKQIEETKKELKQDIRDEAQAIRNEVSIGLALSNQLTNNVVLQTGIPNPPPDDALPDYEEQINETLRRFREEFGLPEVQLSHTPVPQNTINAFESRYLIESEVKRIWNTRVQSEDSNRYIPFGRMVSDLVRYELITPSLGGLLKEVYSIGSAAIHGDEPSVEKIEFLETVTHDILATLISIL